MPVVRSRTFRWVTGLGALFFMAIVIVTIVVWTWPEKKKQTPWERFKESVRQK